MQPNPKENNSPHIADLVVDDIAARKQQGIDTYGVALQANNGRDALQDLYEEILDAACYLRQLIEEERCSGQT
jgi:hypothetical protein